MTTRRRLTVLARVATANALATLGCQSGKSSPVGIGPDVGAEAATSERVTGSLGGFSPTFAQAVALETPTTVIVYLTSFADGCAAVQSVYSHANSTTMELYVWGISPGRYAFVYGVDAGGPRMGQAYFHVWGPACTDQLMSVDGSVENSASSGEITLNQVSSTTVGGSFDLTFLDGRITGTFDAPVCTTPDGGTDGGEQGCQ
jgi:hypothetical protein